MLTVNAILAAGDRSALRAYALTERTALIRFAGYAANFLSMPHAELGRAGNVCPYVPDAVENDLFRLTATLETEAERVEAAMDKMRDVFAEMEPVDGRNMMLKTIVVVFPDVPAQDSKEKIGALQKRLKPSYIKEGFMIGEFFPNCPEPGLHNPHFRPLDTPVPALAVRYITKFDAPFMLGDPSYEAGYLERFGDEGRRRLERVKASRATCPFGHRA
ncbi:hypothetical protein A4R29_15070 [Mesorhizobium ciceri biovar biserrulae]|nr:hypothetical protein A4R29_15070 [Mesorhizobium ciceri biovar biserrulae]